MISRGDFAEIGFVHPLELIGALETKTEIHLLSDLVPFPGGLEKKRTSLLVKNILQILPYHIAPPVNSRACSQ